MKTITDCMDVPYSILHCDLFLSFVHEIIIHDKFIFTFYTANIILGWHMLFCALF